ncbi:MAG: hypothetical protein ACLFNX_12030 [Spirochaetaceae bacterium]
MGPSTETAVRRGSLNQALLARVVRADRFVTGLACHALLGRRQPRGEVGEHQKHTADEFSYYQHSIF